MYKQIFLIKESSAVRAINSLSFIGILNHKAVDFCTVIEYHQGELNLSLISTAALNIKSVLSVQNKFSLNYNDNAAIHAKQTIQNYIFIPNKSQSV